MLSRASRLAGLSKSASRVTSAAVASLPLASASSTSAPASPITSTPSTSGAQGQLVRDWIRDSLYAPKTGYFNSSRVINSPGVINFKTLLGRAEYETRLQELYYAGVQGWSTPVEIFQPYYAQAILRFILSHLTPSVNDAAFVTKQFQQAPSAAPYGLDTPMPHHLRLGTPLLRRDRAEPLFPLRIVEMGAGNGTCALNILDHLQAYYPAVYKTCRYTVLEISESLCAQQRDLLAVHGDHVRIHRANAIDWRRPPAELAAAQREREHTFVIGLEVLDNLPHDKVALGHQVTVVPRVLYDPAADPTPREVKPLLNTSAQPRDWVEVAAPVSDAAVRDTLGLWERYQAARAAAGETAATESDATAGGSVPWWGRIFVKWSLARARKRQVRDVVYLPTDAVRLLRAVRANFPSHTLILADFDQLPSTERRPGLLAPVVARKADAAVDRGETVDEDSYLATAGSCDIFFPTDFKFLKFAYKSIMFPDAAAGTVPLPTETLTGLTVDEEVVAGARQTKMPSVDPSAIAADPALTVTSSGATAGPASTRGMRAVVDTAAVVGNARFMLGFAEVGKTETRNGFNPLLEDYTNMVMFVGSRTAATAAAAAAEATEAAAAAAAADASAVQ